MIQDLKISTNGLLQEQVEELKKAAETTDVFSKLTPEQKARIVSVLRENGHTVGYMGDGINDAAAMKAADIGISVDTAVVVVVIVIAMNVIFWSMKPKKYSQPSTMNTKNNLLETITEGT